MWEKELEAAIIAAVLAKRKIMEIYNTDFEVETKEDDSPVTKADKEADKIIRSSLAKKFPTHAFLTEESSDDKTRLNNDYVWIIDPVDGTKDFVAKNGEFAVNIALAYKHKVVVGVVLIPASGEIYYASKHGGAFYNNGLNVEQIFANRKRKELTVLTSRFHVKDNELALIKKHADVITKVETYGSSIKPCRIARGLAELSYRLSDGTKEWDTAAPQIIVTEAGGVFTKPDGSEITYNREDVYNREGYVIANLRKNILL